MSERRLTKARGCQPNRRMISYKALFQGEPPFSGVSENDGKSFYGNDEELCRSMLSMLSDEYLEERYSLCLEIRDGDRVVHSFPKVACPELILQQLELKSH